MSYQIDQSGKIEQTNKPTVIALANGKTKTIKISAVEKQKLISSIIAIRYPIKNYIYEAFAGLICLLLKGEVLDEVVVDIEYSGREEGIKGWIIQIAQQSGIDLPEISFGHVTKKSNAHIQAIEVFRGNQRVTQIVTAREVLEILY